MRKLTRHHYSETDEAVEITVDDDNVEEGAAPTEYLIELHSSNGAGRDLAITLQFQDGAIHGEGANGVTNEALLAVVMDRLQAWQQGDYACRENALALTHIEQGLMWLQERTRERLERGVEGTEEL